MPGHQKLAPGREFYELLVLNQVSHACTSKLALDVSSRRLGLVCSRLGMSEAESGRLGVQHWVLGAESGRLGAGYLALACLGVILGAWALILGAWASSSSAATFPGLF
ncbi:hypothetical protein PIB30_038327 [Stylosanthes scabra]|uniref:Uncharacterized protein n=1 Tax=Stylosanthes scabra TaxID=79078 RepID=A0ABU6VDJ5_9FABA|nr:hypothetical protein [Stylosanthes scabra]